LKNSNTRLLAIAAVLDNLEKFPCSQYTKEFESALLQEIKEEWNVVSPWMLKNFSKVVEFFQDRGLTSQENLNTLYKFFDVL